MQYLSYEEYICNSDIIFITSMVYAQPNVIYIDEDLQIFNQYISYISSSTQLQELDELLEKTAYFFLDKPYTPHTLEIENEESVVVNLREFDCTTYIETVVALTQTVRSQDYSFENFIKKLKTLRYRYGIVDGYASRLHYFTDWLYENEKGGVLKNVTVLIGGITEDKQLNFMSTHRTAYSQLKFDDSNLSEIIDVEKEIYERGGITYIPKSKIVDIDYRIPHMSIIAFTTSINGLDVTHTGFAFGKDGELTFIHASSAKNKVIIDSLTVSEYCNLQNTCTGIIVGKLL